MTKRFAVILAAGQGTRMKSKLYKVLHQVCGKPMVEHVVDNLTPLSLEKVVTVVGFGAEDVKRHLGDKSEYVLQAEQLGTAHAVMQAAPMLEGKEGTTIVVCGDTPLITTETMEALMQHHTANNSKATILTATMDDPTGYGRIIRNSEGFVEKIVEHKDASESERNINEINTGTYCFDNALLFEALSKVSNENVQGEFYLPDVIEILKSEGHIVSAYTTASFDETIGVNDRVALAEAERIMRQRIVKKHMVNGVTVIDPANTYIETDVTIGSDTILQPGCILKGSTNIGTDCIIGPHTEMKDAIIGDGSEVRQSVVHSSSIGERAAVGPFAHIRPDSELGDEIRVGNFVEIKKTKLGNKSKVSHLSYIGDAEVGTGVNVGCGTITVNYDGKNKFKTTIEDNAFVGCNSNLIAPVTVGEGAYVAAGSTITKDVPEGALAIARERQMNKEQYASKLKK